MLDASYFMSPPRILATAVGDSSRSLDSPGADNVPPQVWPMPPLLSDLGPNAAGAHWALKSRA